MLDCSLLKIKLKYNTSHSSHMLVSYLFTSAKEVMFLPVFVCLSVCLSMC